MKKLFLFSSLYLLATFLMAQDQLSPILFIYDASGSMWGQIDGKTKKEIAAEVLRETVTSLPDDQNIGLIAYGHRKKGDCEDIESLADLNNNDKSVVTKAVAEINPKGKTPLARSAGMAINSLKESKTRATIILITDGIESCDGDLCAVVRNAKAKGIDFKMHIVGFGLKEGEKEQLQCAANVGDGKYYDADNTAGLGDVLMDATRQTVDKPAGNFTVYAVKNGEPVDAWVRVYSASSKKEITADRTYRDTAAMYLPQGSYQVVVKALENTDVDALEIAIEIEEGEKRHENLSFDSGMIKVLVNNNEEAWDATVRVVNPETSKQVSGGRTYGKALELEVNPGKYDINILILRVKGTAVKHTITDVLVKPNETTSISHKFQSGIALVGVKTTDGALIDATVNFYEESTGKNVAGSRTYTSSGNNPREFILNPGIYNVKVQTLGAHAGHKETFKLEVVAGETVQKTLTY